MADDINNDNKAPYHTRKIPIWLVLLDNDGRKTLYLIEPDTTGLNHWLQQIFSASEEQDQNLVNLNQQESESECRDHHLLFSF